MKHLLVKLYSAIPNSVRNYIGKTSRLRFFRDILLKQGGIYREVSALINRTYQSYDISFVFYGSVKDVSRASTGGIENKLLTNSIKLFETYKLNAYDIVGFDIGANFGFLSLVWSQTICKKKGKIYAFEPNRNVFNTLTKSVKKNQLNNKIITCYNALGSEVKEVNIFLDSSTSNIDINSDTLKKEKVIKTKVNMVTLDSFIIANKIERCDFVKIDVDGIELDVLEGSITTLSKFNPIVIIEVNNDKRIIDFISKNNYKILDMDLNEYAPNNKLPLNVFCVPN